MKHDNKTDAQTTPAAPAEKRELTIEELNSIMGGVGEEDGVGGLDDGSAGLIQSIRRC